MTLEEALKTVREEVPTHNFVEGYRITMELAIQLMQAEALKEIQDSLDWLCRDIYRRQEDVPSDLDPYDTSTAKKIKKRATR